LFTGTVIAVLVLLSIVLTASVLYPDMTERQILGILGGGTGLGLLGLAAMFVLRRAPAAAAARPDGRAGNALKATWRMPPLAALAPARLTLPQRVWMLVLRLYLVVAVGMVIVRVVQLAWAEG
jgi:Tfp pilus assembly protein PilN